MGFATALRRLSFGDSAFKNEISEFSQPGGAKCGGFVQGLGVSAEGKRGPVVLRPEPRGPPGEAPLALAESVATEPAFAEAKLRLRAGRRRRAWENSGTIILNLPPKVCSQRD